MQVIYESRPYELTYAARLIEKYSLLKEHVDFKFGACPEAKTIINYLRDMNNKELDIIKDLFDNPIKDDLDIKKNICDNILNGLNKKNICLVKVIDNNIITVEYEIDDIFEQTKNKIKHEYQCKTIINGLQVGDKVVCEKIDGVFVIIGKIQ